MGERFGGRTGSDLFSAVSALVLLKLPPRQRSRSIVLWRTGRASTGGRAVMSDHSCRILVVEDDSIVAADLASELKELGHQVIGLADCSSEAIRLADETAPDLVLMDIRLPGGMDGIDTAIRIRRQRQTPIILVTANSDEAILARAKYAEPVGFITKPFRREDVNATITIALHQHGLSRRLFEEHAWLQVMLGSIRDGVIATDPHGLVRYLNPEAETLIDCVRSKAEGRPIGELYVLRTLQGAVVEECALMQALRTGVASPRTKFFLRAQSGQVRTIEDAATPIFDETGALAGAVAVFQDITVRERAEQERERLIRELERSNEELSRFAHSVAHDLRAPARTVGLYRSFCCANPTRLSPTRRTCST